MNYYYHQDAIHVSRVDLLVKDIEKSINFYTESLGFSVFKNTDEYTSLTANHKDELIRLYKDETAEGKNNMNIYHFALLLPSRKDLSRFLHHLILKQIPIDGAADHIVSEAIYLRDPDGIGIEICSDKDDKDWIINNNNIKMDTLPFDYKGVYYETDKYDLFNSLPYETIIGHLHLQVNNLEKAKEFYQKIIGFSVTNEDVYNAIFMSDKNYHHHLALNSWSRQAKRLNDVPKLKAFTLSYPTCEKYINTINNLESNQIDYHQTEDGIYIKDLENTQIYLKI